MTAPTETIFLGRQPIIDRRGDTFGYELLYRDGTGGDTVFGDPDDATRTVMERALLHWGMERIIGHRFGMINANPSLVVSGLHRSMPPEGIIFEIPEHEPLDDATLDVLLAARREGYHFALDNVRDLDALLASRLLPAVSMVKVEPARVAGGDLPRLLAAIRARSSQSLIVAEKVEHHADFVTWSAHDFDLFQGYHLGVPEVLERAARPAGSASASALFAAMQRDDIDIDDVELLVATDPSLAYRILAVVNSNAFGLDRRVDSVRHALLLLGLDHVRRLAGLLALSKAGEVDEGLLTTGATRARLASRLTTDRQARSAAFTVGLLSVTAAIYRAPLDELLADLPISGEIEAALVDGSGPLGETLAVVLACERADDDALSALAPGRVGELRAAHRAAARWAGQLRHRVSGPDRPAPDLSERSARPLART